MKKFLSKKPVVLTLLLTALGLAVYLNYYLAAVPTAQPGSSTVGNLGDSQFVDNPSVTPQPEDYFTKARQNRAQAHQQSLELIRDVLDDVKATEKMQQQASEQLKQLTDTIAQESKIENLVKAAGFAECVSYIEQDSCYVVVKAAKLSDKQALQISGIAVDQSGIAPQKISIVAVE